MTTRLEVFHAGISKWIPFKEIPTGEDDFLEVGSGGAPQNLIIFTDCINDRNNKQSSISCVPIEPDGVVDMNKEQELVPNLCKGDTPYVMHDIKLSDFPQSIDIRVSNIG